jgi:hypothetical protein
MLYRDDYISPFVSFVDVPVRLDDLLPRIASIDDRLELPCLNQLFELSEEEGYVPGLDLVRRSIDVEIDACLLESDSIVALELVHSVKDDILGLAALGKVL